MANLKKKMDLVSRLRQVAAARKQILTDRLGVQLLEEAADYIEQQQAERNRMILEDLGFGKH